MNWNVNSLSHVSLGLAVFNLGHRNSKENRDFLKTCCREIMYNMFEDKQIIPLTSWNKYLYNDKSAI